MKRNGLDNLLRQAEKALCDPRNIPNLVPCTDANLTTQPGSVEPGGVEFDSMTPGTYVTLSIP